MASEEVEAALAAERKRIVALVQPDVGMWCPTCASPAVRTTGEYGVFYCCIRWPECRASVGSHPNGKPLGQLADPATKRARMMAHEVFDKLWKGADDLREARNWCYRWLSVQLGIERRKCHIAMFDAATCYRVVDVVSVTTVTKVREWIEKTSEEDERAFQKASDEASPACAFDVSET